MNLSPYVKKAISTGVLLLLTSFVILKPDQKLNTTRAAAQLERRAMAVNLGNGNCQYEPPIHEVDPNLDLYKYLLVGFPSGDKRMAYVQYETLTGLHSKDDWDFVYNDNGYTNSPYIKTNYPTHPARGVGALRRMKLLLSSSSSDETWWKMPTLAGTRIHPLRTKMSIGV